MIMARFWLGLPADGLRFAVCVLTHMFAFMYRTGRQACKGLWWVAMPPGLDHCDFPTWHFISRVAVLATVGGWFLHAPLVSHMMAAKPSGDEALVWAFAWCVLVGGSAIAVIANLIAATCLRGD